MVYYCFANITSIHLDTCEHELATHIQHIHFSGEMIMTSRRDRPPEWGLGFGESAPNGRKFQVCELWSFTKNKPKIEFWHVGMGQRSKSKPQKGPQVFS